MMTRASKIQPASAPVSLRLSKADHFHLNFIGARRQVSGLADHACVALAVLNDVMSAWDKGYLVLSTAPDGRREPLHPLPRYNSEVRHPHRTAHLVLKKLNTELLEMHMRALGLSGLDDYVLTALGFYQTAMVRMLRLKTPGILLFKETGPVKVTLP